MRLTEQTRMPGFCTGMIVSVNVVYSPAKWSQTEMDLRGIFSFPPHLPLTRGGVWGTTEDVTTSSLHFSLFSIALWDLANSRPGHSLMLSFQLFFFCLPCLLSPFTAPCKMVLARPDGHKTCACHFSLSLYDGREASVWSDCLLDLGTGFLVDNMVFV